MTLRNAGRTTGALILAAFLLYGLGEARAGTPVGTTLVLVNSVAVVVIGVLVWRSLPFSFRAIGNWYLLGRVLEACFLGAGAFLAATNRAGHVDAYRLGMFALAIGSIPLCLALPRLGWAPRWLALWGAAGYAILAVGMIADFAIDGAALLAALPGGVFEIVFAVHLLRVGFPNAPAPGSGPENAVGPARLNPRPGQS